jgi:hypothetical protein
VTTTTGSGATPLTQMSGRYPQTIANEAHDYAIAHGLSLNALLAMALAEYLAKRREGDGTPVPQLHYRKGHPPADLVRLQQQLMRRDPRGRKLTERCSRVTSAGDEARTTDHVTVRATARGTARSVAKCSPYARAEGDAKGATTR